MGGGGLLVHDFLENPALQVLDAHFLPKVKDREANAEDEANTAAI